MSTPVVQHVGRWLPKDPRALQDWLAKKISQVERTDTGPENWKPVIQEFQQLIEGDPDIFMGFHQMFDEVPTKPPYNNDPSGKPQARNSWVYSVVQRLMS